MHCGSQDLFGDIAKEIVKKRDNARALVFTEKVGEMLKQYGVTPIVTEFEKNETKGNNSTEEYGFLLTGFDFTERDRKFNNTIVFLESEKQKLECELKEKEEELERCKKNGCKIVIVAKEINGVPYVTLEDFLEAVKN